MEYISKVLCWLSAHADWAAVIVTTIGLYYAYQQSKLWLTQLKVNKREEIATAISRTARRIEQTFRHVRQQFPAPTAKQRLEDLIAAESHFQDLIVQCASSLTK
jgi:hypothetical protein